MGFTEVLTIVFIALKLLGVISWSWWLVLLPEILAFVVYAIMVISAVVVNAKVTKSMEDFDRKW
jgi:transmembrane fragile-X-F protein